MSDPSLALQIAVRARLIGHAPLTSIVPAGSILDRTGRPEIDHSYIVLGEGQTLYSDNYEAFAETVFLDLHIWAKTGGVDEAKAIAGHIRNALKPEPWTVEGFDAIKLTVANARYLRDPNGDLAHGVVTVEAILKEAA